MTKKFLLIKTGKTWDSIRARYGCFEDWLVAGLGVSHADVEVVSVFEGGLLPTHLDDVGSIIITGSPTMVTERLPWSEAVARWLAFELLERKTRVPVLGICYGHQLLAHALGGRVEYNPRGREIGTVEIRATAALADDPLLGEINFPLLAQVTHLQSVTELPPGAIHLASSALEPHHAFRFGETVWGVQFHPEFTADIMRAYLDVLGERMIGEGMDVAGALAGVRDTLAGAVMLRRFAQLARAG